MLSRLVGHDGSIPVERIETLRPATPIGRPIIGRHPRAPTNLLFNTGHGALGFTLAFGSAQRVARLLADGG